MTDETNIQPIQPDFEQIKKTGEDGKEYWSVRELAEYKIAINIGIK